MSTLIELNYAHHNMGLQAAWKFLKGGRSVSMSQAIYHGMEVERKAKTRVEARLMRLQQAKHRRRLFEHD